MTQVMVRYKVVPECAIENVVLVRAVYEELRHRRPAGLRYATFKLDDGVSFVHLAVHETVDGSNPLTGLPAFQAFQRDVRERCEEPPTVTTLHAIDFYRFPDA